MNLLKNRTVIGVICIVLSLIICFAVTPLFNQSISEKTEIVRVVKPVKNGEEIQSDMVKQVEVGGYNLPEDVVKSSDTVIGKFATADLAVGDYILSSKLAEEPTAENAYLYHLTGEKQAISVSVKNFANGLSGKLQSGDIVSVIAPDYKKQGSTVIPAELQYVEVIAVTANSGSDANTGEQTEESEERELPDTVTLLVTPEQSKSLQSLRQTENFTCLWYIVESRKTPSYLLKRRRLYWRNCIHRLKKKTHLSKQKKKMKKVRPKNRKPFLQKARWSKP